MIHFPSSLHAPNSLPNRSDSLKLNATQQKSASHPIFLTIEEELHDARRVHSHGQEEDLRLALNMVIERLAVLSTMLSDAYKTTADLEVQLNVTKSNLALVSANNEMLEDALKQRDSTTQNVGWRRTSGRAYSTDDTHLHHTGEHTPIDSPAQESSRFFKFRFTPSSSSSALNASLSRPASPAPHLNSPSLPTLGTVKEKERESKEREQHLEKELEKERKAREVAKKEKEALEEELESLSQALFEEANKMVATERIRRADVEEELREAKLEKEALRSALRLLEGQATSVSAPASFSSSPVVLPSESPAMTTSPTSITDPASSTTSLPGSQHLQPSLSSIKADTTTSTSTKTTRPPLPPPAPLSVPTTPFDYDTTFASPDTATPMPHPSTAAAAVPEADTPPTAVLATEEPKLAPVEVLVEKEAPKDHEVPPAESHPAPLSTPALEAEAADADKHRPSTLHLTSLPLPHEHDPWADAPPSRGGVVGGTS